MDPSSKFIDYIPSVGDVCLVDCATTHTILRDRKYFSNLTLVQSNVHTISGPIDLIKGFRRAIIIMCKTRENFQFLQNGKIIISIKTRNFSRSRMMKRISPLESKCEI